MRSSVALILAKQISQLQFASLRHPGKYKLFWASDPSSSVAVDFEEYDDRTTVLMAATVLLSFSLWLKYNFLTKILYFVTTVLNSKSQRS